jgi:putative cell wall-binding protein
MGDWRCGSGGARRSIYRWLAVVVVSSAVWGLDGGQSAAADRPPVRLAGTSRYETTVAVARAAFPTAIELTIARGDLFPDALAAAYYSNLHAPQPILLVRPTEAPATVLDQIHAYATATTHGLMRITIVGDVTAVSVEVEARIRAAANPWTELVRHSGRDRYGTAYAMAVNKQESAGTVFVVSGENYPDALSIGPIAHAAQIPILLTRRDQLPASTIAGLKALYPVDEVVVVGGTSAVSNAVLDQIRANCQTCSSVRRIAGADRFETATLVADWAISRWGFTATHVNLVGGRNFPDAIGLGPHGGRERSVTLFASDVNELGAATRAWLVAHAATIDSIHVIGDSTVISDAVVADAVRAST